MCKKFSHHSPTRALRSLALAPCWKILAMPVIILFMFALYISRYPSVRNTQFPWICIFFLLFLFQISPQNPPKVCTRSFNFNLKNAKAPSCQGHSPPTSSPRSSARLRFTSNIVDNLAPPGKNSCVRPCQVGVLHSKYPLITTRRRVFARFYFRALFRGSKARRFAKIKQPRKLYFSSHIDQL